MRSIKKARLRLRRKENDSKGKEGKELGLERLEQI